MEESGQYTLGKMLNRLGKFEVRSFLSREACKSRFSKIAISVKFCNSLISKCPDCCYRQGGDRVFFPSLPSKYANLVYCCSFSLS